MFHFKRKVNFLTSLPTLLIALLTGCGGGGGSEMPPTQPTPPSKAAINIMLATAPDDRYFASAQSEGQTLALFAEGDSQSAVNDALIYNNSTDQVSFIRTDDATSYNRMLINDYQFDSRTTESGAEITVTAPSGEQEVYYVDSEGEFLQPDDSPADNGGTGKTSCIATPITDDYKTYCMDLDPALYPKSYCDVDFLNNQAGGNGYIASASYSTTQLCADRGYLYNHSEFNEEGWSAWYDFPASSSKNSLTTFTLRALVAENPFDTSACNELMYDDNDAWSTCINQQITAFTAHAQVGFSEIFRSIIETYHNDLLPAFEKANDYVKSVHAESDFSIEAATPKAFVTDTIDDLLDLGKSTLQGLNKYFSAVEAGSDETDDPELEALLGVIYSGADEPTDTDTDTDIGTVKGETSCEIDKYDQDDGGSNTMLHCVTKNSEGITIATRGESITFSPSASQQTTYIIEIIDLKVEKSENFGFDDYGYLTTAKTKNYMREDINDINSVKRRGFWDESWQYESGKETITTKDIFNHASLRVYNDNPRNDPNQNSVTASKTLFGVSESCKLNPQYRPILSDYSKSVDNEQIIDDVRVCPFSLEYSDDMTRVINTLESSDMWLKTGEYEQFLVAE